MKKNCSLTKEITFARLNKRQGERVALLKRLMIVLLFFVGLSAHAKTTYIPTYRSYIHIVDGSDTISISNRLSDIELSEKSVLFTLRLEQEDVTQEKVRAIKRAKRAAGWATFSAVMSGIIQIDKETGLCGIISEEEYKALKK